MSIIVNFHKIQIFLINYVIFVLYCSYNLLCNNINNLK